MVMMKTVKISDFKARCIAILKSLARNKATLIVTHRGKPLVKVEPFQAQSVPKRLGELRGCIKVKGDIINSDFADDWESGRR